jgi:hypothetical protein
VRCYALRNQRAAGDGAARRDALEAVADAVVELDQARPSALPLPRPLEETRWSEQLGA